MSWAYGRGWFRGRERPIGYGVEAKCDHRGCKERIDRGLEYRCGSVHDTEHGCGGFFCHGHQMGIETPEGDCISLCPSCHAAAVARYRKDGWDAEEGMVIEAEEAP